ncbi:MAG: hypothetical protein MI799_15415 [Desulfobacterales bacterium]|nr:hypothetical protein [Desulfobacterales bacterium]
MNSGKVIAVAGNQSTCADVLAAVCHAGYTVTYLLHMDRSHAHYIADYQDLANPAARHGVEVIRPKTYAMNDKETRALFKRLNIDLLISAGWQRLFPEWFLNSLSIGAFGMHGSAEHLPRGRGRSPMNWSLIEGRDRFFTSLFKYDPGVDSGAIVGTQRFDVTARDTIQSLRHKNTLSQIRLLLHHLPDLLANKTEFVPQPTDVEPTYYPKRTPEDGAIDWRESVLRVDRLVRAVSRPYPGAFTSLAGKRINVWGGIPFDTHLCFDEAEPGEVVGVFNDNTFAVRCGDLTYYVNDWESPDEAIPAQGDIFESVANQSLNKLTSMYAETEQPGYSFTRAQYLSLLEALRQGGYTYGFYDEAPRSKTVFLRHDVDKNVHMALEMARIEHEQEVRASYFFLLRGGLYNLLEPETSQAVREIAGLGHKIGLHCDLNRIPGGYNDVDSAVLKELDAFAAVCPVEPSRMVTFHNPPPEVINHTPANEAYLSGYAPSFMLPETKYISESNACWREGFPTEMIRSGQWPRLQILVHPLWWMWDSPRKTTEILAEILSGRGREQDGYLRHSNRLWHQFTQQRERER